MNKIKIENPVDAEQNTCNGIVLKAFVNNFFSEKGNISFTVRLVPSKEKSCKGCERCAWQHDCLGEISNDWPVIGIDKCVNGKLYVIRTCNESTDFESGQIDSWDLCLKEFTE